MARILLVGGGCRGRALAASLVHDGHALRITTRVEAHREAIEQAGAECWLGTPGRLATLRGALEGVTLVCWLLGSARGRAEELLALHRERLDFFLTHLIDTTVRGVLYEARGTSTPATALAAGEETLERVASANAIPFLVLRADPAKRDEWLAQARAGVVALIG